VKESIMNRFNVAVVATIFLALTSVSAFADPLATQPAVAVPAPAVRQAAPRVEIFAFSAVSPQPGQTDWIGRGIQESLQSEVAHTGATLMIPVHAPAAADDAITVARQNKADLAVIGTYQVVGDDVRVNGHLLDVASNNTVGSFSATGPQKSLFNIEDALGEQLRRLLPASPMPQQAAAAQPQAPQPTVTYQQDPAEAYAPPAPTVNNYYDATPDYGAYYPDTYYGYGYGYPAFGFYGGLGYYGGGFYHGGFNRGGFVGHGGGVVGHGGGFVGHAGGGFGGGHGGFGGGRGGFGGGHGGGGHR